MAEAREQRGAASDLVGLGPARGHELFELTAMGPAEVREGRPRICTGGGGIVRAAHGAHRVVEAGERVLRAREEEVVHGGQQNERPALGEWGPFEDGEHVLVVGHPAADGGVGGRAIALGHGGEAAEVVGEWLLDEHRINSSPAAAD